MTASLTSSLHSARPSLLRAALVGCAVVLPFLLIGCGSAAAPGADEGASQKDHGTGADEGDDASSESTNGSAGSATFTVGDRVFTIDLTLCGVYADATEIVLAGAAKSDDGSAVGFFEGDLVPFGDELNGEFRIDIGADGPSQSTDEFLALGYASGSAVTLDEEGSGYVVRSGAWNEQGDDLGAGSLAFACS